MVPALPVLLRLLLHASPEQFRTGWFLESVVSASLVVLVIPTRQPFFKSQPSRYLLVATLLVVVATVMLPYSPFSAMMGFTPAPWPYLDVMGMIVGLYIVAAEMAKKLFYRYE